MSTLPSPMIEPGNSGVTAQSANYYITELQNKKILNQN